jgi:hypothetical protein
MRVQLIGGIADQYGQLTGIVKCVREHVSGLAHHNKYRVEFFHAADEWFYEFQLASPREDGDSDRRGATACA